jgi:hypothetical protein
MRQMTIAWPRVNSLRRSHAERLQAWLVTGPLGHLWSVVADVTILLTRYAAQELRQRMLAGAGRRPSRRR